MQPERKRIAVGVLYNQKEDAVLITKRPPGSNQAGYWEFPGGKIEAGEDPKTALTRELIEEVNISLINSSPLVDYEYDYPEHPVHLHVLEVTHWSGRPEPNEDQEMQWVMIAKLPEVTMLDGNAKIIDYLIAKNS